MKEVESILKNAGFSEERIFDITAILEMYKKNSYNYNKLQIDFIKKYGNLEIHYLHPIWKEDVVVRLNPIEAQKALTMDVVEEYNVFLGDELLIIGDIDKENITLFMSRNGEFYGGYDDCIIKWGNNFEKMLLDLSRGENEEIQIMG